MSRYKAQLKLSSRELKKVTESIRLTRKQWLQVGEFLLEQVHDRFKTQGRSGNALWPDKQVKAWGHNDGRAVLTGASGDLLEEWQVRLVKSGVQLYNPVKYTTVHQEGTVGKGGKLPTIKPVTAKALFVPITDRAKESERLSGSEAMYVRQHGGASKLRGSIRVHPPSWPDTGLKKGRLKDGTLEVWDELEGEYVPGIPDFIFLAKIDIPPRPMLPTSQKEVVAQLGFIHGIHFGEVK